MMAAPGGIDANEIKEEVEKFEGVVNIHHLHLWKLNDNTIHFETHIEVKNDTTSNLMPIKEEIEELLEHKYGINHTTIQFEIGDCATDLV